MADIGIYIKNADIVARAGANVNSTAINTTATDIYILDIEALINDLTRYNWTDAVTKGLNADVEGILREAGACFAAIYAIQWDMSGFTTRIEAEDMINVLRDRALFAISILRDKKVQDFINGA